MSMAAEEKTSGLSKKLSEHARDILRLTRDTEFLQSFLRVDDSEENDGEGRVVKGSKKSLHEDPVPLPPHIQQPQPVVHIEPPPQERPRSPRGGATPGSVKSSRKGAGSTTFSQLAKDLKLKKSPRRARGKRRRNECRQEEVYTDKDRAAAVNMGTRDIKQSLKLKRQQDRTRALQIPDEAEPGTLLALGSHELRNGDVRIAINFMHKALELNPNDKNALVARSKCYLLLGEPQLSLQDAETALKVDKSFIRGIFQKAEALYHLGNFEHSLMYYHRGHRLRPELEGFRLGIQKAQEAIENTIGGKTLAGLDPGNLSIIEEVKRSSSAAPTPVASSEVKRAGSGKSRPATAAIRRQARHLLGELCVDKDYLEQLLKHPDIKCLHQEAGHIASHAEEGIAFLTNRQEFWRQQKPAATTKKKEKRQQRSSQLVM